MEETTTTTTTTAVLEAAAAVAAAEQQIKKYDEPDNHNKEEEEEEQEEEEEKDNNNNDNNNNNQNNDKSKAAETADQIIGQQPQNANDEEENEKEIIDDEGGGDNEEPSRETNRPEGQQQQQQQDNQSSSKTTTAATTTTTTTTTASSSSSIPHSSSSSSSSPLRILYIVTTLAEYNTGHRATVKGSDRLQSTLIPVLREGVESMLSFGYHVDVYIICHYTLLPERYQLIRNAIVPSSVRVDYWDDATPLGYSMEHDMNRTQPITRALARQHRFVIKEKLLEYDLFVNFEDDMLIKGDHVQQFLKVTHDLEVLRRQAPEQIIMELDEDEDEEQHKKEEENQENQPDALEQQQQQRRRQAMMKRYTGPMTKAQLSRMIPGWIRVEVLLDEDTHGAQTDTGPVPVNLTFIQDGDGGVIVGERHIDPKPCCHVSAKTVNMHMPASPDASKLFLWETGILALGVRQMPRITTSSSSSSTSSSSTSLDWVVLQRGPQQEHIDPNAVIGEYWSGRDGYFRRGEKRPMPSKGNYVNNQGGWMATRRQIWEWHTEQCPGGFLPPFDAPHYRFDGLDLRNVEYWSGGLNLFTHQHACNLQRIIPISHPDDFSRHLIYHTANNKQRQLNSKRKHFTKADTLLGQLNTVRHNSEKALGVAGKTGAARRGRKAGAASRRAAKAGAARAAFATKSD